jgi:HEAT repeat protein
MEDYKNCRYARELMRNEGEDSHLRKSASMLHNIDRINPSKASGESRITQKLSVNRVTQRQLVDLRSPNEERRIKAIRAAETSGKPPSPAILQALEEALQDESAEVRAAAVDALGLLGGVRQKTVLLLAIADRAWDVRAAVVKALGMLGDAAPILTLLRALCDEHYVVRISAIWALQQLGLKRLTKPLQYEEDVQSFSWIAQMEVEPTLLTAIVELCMKDSNELVRAAAVEALGEFQDAAFSVLFVSTLHDPSELVRLEAMSALGKLDEQVFLDDLILKINDPSELVQEEAKKILGNLSPSLHHRITFELLLQLLQDGQENLRALAAWLLGERGDIRATDFLLAAQQDESPMVQEAVNWALEQLILSEEQLQEQSRSLQQAQQSKRALYFLTGGKLESSTKVVGALDEIFGYLTEKRGFIVIDRSKEGCVLLTIGYECSAHETAEELRDQLSRYAPVQALSDAPRNNLEDKVSRDLEQMQRKLAYRPWLERFVLHLSRSIPGTQSMPREALSRIMISMVHFQTLRTDDVRIDQCQERYLLDGRSQVFNSHLRSIVEKTLASIHEFDGLQIWYGSARETLQLSEAYTVVREWGDPSP